MAFKFKRDVDLTKISFQLKIADLGFAKKVLSLKEKVASRVGTPLYMSPETLKGLNYDYRSDIWSLGATYFELLTGVPPFIANSEAEL
jgi:serine/threonine protein kinase